MNDLSLVERCTSVDLASNRLREYVIEVGPTLTGELEVTTWRGRIGQKLRKRTTRFEDEVRGLEEVADIVHRRLSHGYLFI